MYQPEAGIEKIFFDSGFFYLPLKKYFSNPERNLIKQVPLFFYFSRKERNPMPLFTTNRIDQAFERFMKHQPNYKLDAPEADRIQAELNTEKEKGRIPMIYRDDRHQNTFEKEASIRPDTASRKLLAALYLLTANGSLWTQVRDHVGLRQVYVDLMHPKNLNGTSYVFFSAARDILTGSRNIQLMEIADPSLLSLQSYMILCTALAIRAYGVEKANRIQFNKEWE